MRARVGVATGILLLTAGGAGFVCAGGDHDVARQVQAGAQVWEQRCASCHGPEGGNGPLLDADLLRSYGRARPLFDYNRMAMPWDAPGTLTDSVYWAVTAYLIRSRGFRLDRVLDESTADSASLLE